MSKYDIKKYKNKQYYGILKENLMIMAWETQKVLKEREKHGVIKQKIGVGRVRWG